MAKIFSFVFILLSVLVYLNPVTATSSSCSPLYVAAFNIQIFGVTKASKSDVMSVLANITLRYDIMLVQEIRDSSMTAIYQLLDLVNSIAPDGDLYGMALSERTGRSSSKEQYSFFYRLSRVSVVSTHQFNDTEGDYFEREPFSVLFQHNCSNSSAECEKFWLQAIHTKPTQAVQEIDSIYLYSFPDASAAFSSPQGMLLGDLNADCSYVSDSAALLLEFSLDSNFSFLLAKGEIDTTVSSTYCTYDNFIVPSNFSLLVRPGSARIFNFMTSYGLTLDFAKDVSDHYPIELVLDIEQCTSVPTIEPTPDPFDMLEENCTTLKVAAFNIQVFGVTKASKSDVMSVLANITLRYDIMLVQEIRDSSMTAIYQLLDLVNSIAPDGDLYGMALSERTGRSSSKEQYSFFYRLSRVSVVSTHQFNDTEGDYFEREPFSVLFQHNCSNSSAECEKFWLQAIHTKPTQAVQEIDSIYLYSFPDASAAFSSPQGMLLGDLNADCSYVSDSAALLLEFSLDSNFSFLLAKGEIDTTVSSTYCTYDNFIVPSNFSLLVRPGSARIFNFMTSYGLTLDFAKDVSDHYPIELVLDIEQCTSVPTIEPTPDPFDMLEENCTTLKVAAFNIQVFGVTKASKSDVMSVLANITLRYDIMLVQEIRDSSMTAIYQLLDLVNSIAPDGDLYGMALSERTGRSSSKEQYSFFYRLSRVSVVSTHQFNDTEGDYFEREPFSVLFQHNCSNSSTECEKFWLQAIHTKPTQAVQEIDSIYLYSFPDASAAFSSPQGMLLGDLNADCSYVSDSAALLLEFSLDSNFSFLLAKGEIDTTVSSTYCTYDNFIVPSNFSLLVRPGSARIFNFMTSYGLTLDFAKDVSDHYPIELEFTFPCDFTVAMYNIDNGSIELIVSSMLLAVMSCFVIFS